MAFLGDKIAIIPPQLLQKQIQIPKTEAQKLQAQQQTQSLTPQQQQQLTTYQTQISTQQETLSKINLDLKAAEAELQRALADYSTYTKSSQIKDPRAITAKLQYQGTIKDKISAIKQTQNVAKNYLISYSQAQTYTKGLITRAKQEEVYQKSQETISRKFKQEYGVAYTPQKAREIQREAMKKYEQGLKEYQTQSPTSTRMISGYDWLGNPKYVSVDPQTLTPHQKSMQQLGLPLNYQGELPITPSFYEKSEKWVGQKVIQPIQKRTGITTEKLFQPIPGIEPKEFKAKEGTIFSRIEKKIEPYSKPSKQYVGGVVSGFGMGLATKPIKTISTAGAFFILPGVLGVSGRYVAPISKALPTASKVVGGGLKYGLPTVYAGSVGYRVGTAPGGAFGKGVATGEIASTEIMPMLIGGYAGAKTWPKVAGWWRTKGRTEIPTQELVPFKVMSGEKTFPTAPTQKHLSLFKERGVGFHATPEPWAKLSTGIGSSELPGTYVSSYISPHFLKVTGQSSLYGGSLFQPYGKPLVMKIKPTGFIKGRWVKTKPYKLDGQTFNYKWKGTGKPGFIEIPAMKSEIEGVIRTDINLVKTDGKYFFRWKGVRVPIDTFEIVVDSAGNLINVIPKVPTKSPGVSSQTLKELSSSYKAVSTKTPSSTIFGGLTKTPISIIPKVSKAPSKSKIPSQTISEISSSYKPVSTPITTPGSFLMGSLIGSPSITSSISKPSYVSKPSVSIASLISKPSVSRISKPSVSRISKPSVSKVSKPLTSPISVLSSSYFPGESYRQPLAIYKREVPKTKPSEEEKRRRSIFGGSLDKRPSPESWDAFVLKESTTPPKRKWQQVADDVPLITALSRGSIETDRSISARFKVKKDTKTKQHNPVVEKDWDLIKHKFRNWKQKKGHREKTPGVWYEKRRYLIDAPGEVRRLQTEKKASSLLIGGFGSPQRKPPKSKSRKKAFRL